MISAIEEKEVPEWLTLMRDDGLPEVLPLKDLLHGSLYYPASGFDGTPVQHMAGNIYSFVYVDYGSGREALSTALQECGFSGYRVIGRRQVLKAELIPNGWSPPVAESGTGDPRRYQQFFEQPFCDWIVFEREPGKDQKHGPTRFSLLYLCADGVAAFHALYRSNNLTPAALAIIRPGTGFGLNWTDFTHEAGPLYRAVSGNPAGMPEFLLFGGNELEERSCWAAYSQLVAMVPGKTNVSIWRCRT